MENSSRFLKNGPFDLFFWILYGQKYPNISGLNFFKIKFPRSDYVLAP